MPNCHFCTLLDELDCPGRIIEFEHSVAFLHSDQTFTGRSLLILKPHYQHLHELSENLFASFNRELRTLAEAINGELRPERLNYAVLGNVTPHVHWHLIPRYPDDPNQGGPPWPVRQPVEYPEAWYRDTARRLRQRAGR